MLWNARASLVERKKSTKKEKALGRVYKEERKFNGTERTFLYQEVIFIRERRDST